MQQSDISISHLIPLYRSERFHDVIAANIRALADPWDEIILSDRNGDAAYCDRLKQEFGDLPNLRVICREDDAHWVRNIADLIAAARGTFLRILPHDDSTDRRAVNALEAKMRAEPDLVLAYGQIKAIELDGTRIPWRDEMNRGEDPDARGWSLEDALPMFWQGRFPGAFKGLIRTEAAQRPALKFEATPELIYSERAWLFALGLTGRFGFVPQRVLTKRYYADSTHRRWEQTPEAIKDVTDTMAAYANRILTDPESRTRVEADLHHNCARHMQALRNGDPMPRYESVADHATQGER